MRGPTHRIVLLCAFAHALLAIITAWSIAPTYDESAHVGYGVSLLKGDPRRSTPSFVSKMPVSMLNAMPRAIGRAVESSGAAPGIATFLLDTRVTRLATVIASIVLLFMIVAWTRALYGDDSANVAAVLYVLSPNILAHASLATTDLYSTLAAVAASYAFWRFATQPSRNHMVVSAVVLGLAQLTKFSAVFLFPVQIVTAIGFLLSHRRQERSQHARTFAWYFLGAGVLSVAIINAGFLFDHPLRALRDYTFDSEAFRAIQRTPGLNAIPIPLPTAYVQGFDGMRNHEQTGKVVPAIYLLGELRTIGAESFHPFRYYYLVVYGLKEPIVLQGLFLIALISVSRTRTRAAFVDNEWFVICPLAFYFLNLSLLSSMQTGIRFILPCLALSLILSASVLRNWRTLATPFKALAGGCIVWLALSLFSYFPNSLSYANEFVWDRKNAWKLYADSNLSWGQDAWVVRDFLRDNPDVAFEPPGPTSGRVLIGVNSLVGISIGAERYAWLRQYEPIGQVGYGHILFNVPK